MLRKLSLFPFFIVFAIFLKSVDPTLAVTQERAADLAYDISTASLGFKTTPPQSQSSVLTSDKPVVLLWSLRNTGTVPLMLRGKIFNRFESTELDTTVIKQRVFLEKDHELHELIFEGDGYFYFQESDSAVRFEPSAETTLQVRAEIELDAGNSYQDQQLETTLLLQAKQVQEGSIWQ